MTDTVSIDFARIEAVHLAGLVVQFTELLEESSFEQDEAIRRLVPDGYQDDPAAAAEFRQLTQSHLLDRRMADARMVLRSLPDAEDLPGDLGDPSLMDTVTVALSADAAQAWLRTLAAVRLVMATRLGIDVTDGHDEDDPRFSIYEWLGYRLHTLVEAIESGTEN